MANTVSGKLAEIELIGFDLINANLASITTNEASIKSLYRYVGIIDQVQKVENVQIIDVNDSYAIEALLGSQNGKVLLTHQDDLSENGVYQLTEGVISKVIYHNLEMGNLIEILAEGNDAASVFYQLGDENSWTEITMSDGTVSIDTGDAPIDDSDPSVDGSSD